MVIAKDNTLELVWHQVSRIVTLVTIGWVEGILAITWFLSSPKAASVITVPSSFSFSSLSETAGAFDWQHVRTQREKKLVICSDVRDSELENIRLAVSYLCAITDLTTCAGVSCYRGGNVKARYTVPTRKDCMASAIWLAVSASWPSHYNSKMGLDRCHLPRNLIVALYCHHESLYHSILNVPLPFHCLAYSKAPKKKKATQRLYPSRYQTSDMNKYNPHP